MNYDNVILFGAGASVDAGIPLLDNFVDVMWGYSMRGKTARGAIEDADKALLDEANRIRIDLERFNSRANFKLRNLEDVLSLLSFEALARSDARDKYEVWKRAITRTVELSTIFPYSSSERETPNYGKSLYHSFWDIILGGQSLETPPALISFNYDLVFERALWDYFHYFADNNAHFKPKHRSFKVNYFFKPYDFVIHAVDTHYEVPQNMGGIVRKVRLNGVRPAFTYNSAASLDIPYLKLHGSLNWSSDEVDQQKKNIDTTFTPKGIPIQAVDTPFILPPVFNKMNSVDIGPVWTKALEILRAAKHIIIVGYSLPKTDIYMQYFLKSAVGPNSNLNKIIVFDPELFKPSPKSEEMRNRYRECFSPQFQEQITFEPKTGPWIGGADQGTFSHFIQSMRHNRAELLF